MKNFTEDRAGSVYGYVRGFSMWPLLIPGDILRAEAVPMSGLSAGDIVVLEPGSDEPVVHRLMDISGMDSGCFNLITAGDRSGVDSQRRINVGEELLRITGVLRRGRWKVPLRKPLPLCARLPLTVVRLHCRLVRKLFW